MRSFFLDAALNRLVVQFNMDSAPYCGGKLNWSLTAKNSEVCTFVRVRENSTGLTKSVLTLKKERVPFLVTLAFVELMKMILSKPKTEDIVKA
jgi:hypothetical protein